MLILGAGGQALAETIREIPGIQDADAVTGEFDVVVILESHSLSELRALMTAVQRVEGVLKTTTSVVLG